jgi:CDP-glycerol glycerophosphotransferase
MAPRLSVVVPIYNVQRYLDECLSSIAAQTLTDLEVVMVDDGSTDDSAAIAERFAAGDARFRLVRQENQGLGPARNTGIRNVHPDAEFLAFFDSDDTAPPAAYQLMVETLDRTGSDFVSGNVLRFRSVGYTQSPVHKKPFAETSLRTHISKQPNLVTDRTAWNKVYRRTFWDRHGMEYPGILYEDAPVSVPLHFLAESVDILSEPIYHWREREVGARSITQNRTDPKGLIDRIASMSQVRTFLKEQAAADSVFAKHLRFYDENSLVEEIPLFFRALPDGDAAFHDAFLDHVGAFITRIGSDVLDTLPEPLRLKYWLTAKRRLTDLLDLLVFEREYPWTIPVKGTVRHYADYPSLKDSPPVPEAILRLDSELTVRTGLYTADWREGRLHLSGFAYPKHFGAEHRSDAVKALILREKGSRRLLALPAKTVFAPEVTASTHDQPLRHCSSAGGSGWTAPGRSPSASSAAAARARAGSRSARTAAASSPRRSGWRRTSAWSRPCRTRTSTSRSRRSGPGRTGSPPPTTAAERSPCTDGSPPSTPPRASSCGCGTRRAARRRSWTSPSSWTGPPSTPTAMCRSPRWSTRPG